MTNERVERSGRSPLSSDGGDGAPAFIYSGGWDQGVRKGMGVTSFGNGDEFRGRYQVGSLSQSPEKAITQILSQIFFNKTRSFLMTLMEL